MTGAASCPCASLLTVCFPVWSDGYVCEYGITFETHIVEKFDVSFGREGETMSLGCTVIIYPSLQRFKPEIEWYRDGNDTIIYTLLSKATWEI